MITRSSNVLRIGAWLLANLALMACGHGLYLPTDDPQDGVPHYHIRIFDCLVPIPGDYVFHATDGSRTLRFSRLDSSEPPYIRIGAILITDLSEEDLVAPEMRVVGREQVDDLGLESLRLVVETGGEPRAWSGESPLDHMDIIVIHDNKHALKLIGEIGDERKQMLEQMLEECRRTRSP